MDTLTLYLHQVIRIICKNVRRWQVRRRSSTGFGCHSLCITERRMMWLTFMS